MRVVRPTGKRRWRQHHNADGTPKVVYRSLAAAQRARVPDADAYLCQWCRQWHLGNDRRRDRRASTTDAEVVHTSQGRKRT
jgi:hypothetical protein